MKNNNITGLFMEKMNDSLLESMLSKSKILAINEHRINVENNNLDYIESFIECMRRNRKVANTTVLFSIFGYDDDTRELYQIPEVISYTRELLDKYPYFLLFFNDLMHIKWAIICYAIIQDVEPYKLTSGNSRVELDMERYLRLIQNARDTANNIEWIDKSIMDRFDSAIYTLR